MNKKKEEIFHFVSSLRFDRRLAKYDIKGSIAYAEALRKAKVINAREASKIIGGLSGIEKEFMKNRFPFKKKDEDIHMAIERRLIEKIGSVGGKIHTGRSRNDQVAVDIRMFLKDEIDVCMDLLKDMQSVVKRVAKKNIDFIMPGFTHLQHGQPILLSHHLMAYYHMFSRDIERLKGCRERTDVMPLGSSAIAGTPYPIDRRALAKALSFSKISPNSVDATSDRDFIIEFLSCAAIISVHLSRLCEEVIIWSSSEFSFVTVGEDFATGSSIMPQKRNPDIAELIRAKAGRINGALVGMLTVMKGLPLAYNRDMQEDKEGLFDVVDTVKDALKVASGLMASLRFNRKRMREMSDEGFCNATECADYLVKKGVPFRKAHGIVKNIVNECIRKNIPLDELPIQGFKRYSQLFKRDIYNYLKIENSINRRTIEGGTAIKNVEKQIKKS